MPPKLMLTDYRSAVAASRQATFEFFSRVEDWPRWAKLVVAVQAPQGGWRRGVTLGFKPRFNGTTLPMLKVKVHAYEPGRLIRWGVSSPLGSQYHQFEFQDAPHGCVVHHSEWAEGLMCLINWPLRRGVARFNERWADDLARAMQP